MRPAPMFRPGSEAMRAMLVDLGESLQAQCHELYKAPTAERAERLAINLNGACRLAQAFRERLLAEGEAGGQ